MDRATGNHPAIPTQDRPSLRTWAMGLDKPTLTDRPQTWGLMPTFRFWNRIDTWKQQAPFLGLGLLGAAGLCVLAPVFFAQLGLIGGTMALLILSTVALSLPLGLFERWLRAEIVRRKNTAIGSPNSPML